MRVAVTSGYWDPIHKGHIALFEGAKKLADKLIVLIHRDSCCEKKKGYCFMPLDDKLAVLRSIKWIDEIIVCGEKCDGTVTELLEKVRELYPSDELIFAKGGDRTPENMPKKELEICDKLGIKIVYGVGGEKVQSSSWLVKQLLNSLKSKE